jgi:hypothetical protein
MYSMRTDPFLHLCIFPPFRLNPSGELLCLQQQTAHLGSVWARLAPWQTRASALAGRSVWLPSILHLSIHRCQVWGGAAPSPQHNVSASSAPASTDPLSNQAEMQFRPNMDEGWRPGNGTWADDDPGEFSLVSLQNSGMAPDRLPSCPLLEDHSPLHQGRPRQVSVAHGVTFSPHTVSH